MHTCNLCGREEHGFTVHDSMTREQAAEYVANEDCGDSIVDESLGMKTYCMVKTIEFFDIPENKYKIAQYSRDFYRIIKASGRKVSYLNNIYEIDSTEGAKDIYNLRTKQLGVILDEVNDDYDYYFLNLKHYDGQFHAILVDKRGKVVVDDTRSCLGCSWVYGIIGVKNC